MQNDKKNNTKRTPDKSLQKCRKLLTLAGLLAHFNRTQKVNKSSKWNQQTWVSVKLMLYSSNALNQTFIVPLPLYLSHI